VQHLGNYYAIRSIHHIVSYIILYRAIMLSLCSCGSELSGIIDYHHATLRCDALRCVAQGYIADTSSVSRLSAMCAVMGVLAGVFFFCWVPKGRIDGSALGGGGDGRRCAKQPPFFKPSLKTLLCVLSRACLDKLNQFYHLKAHSIFQKRAVCVLQAAAAIAGTTTTSSAAGWVETQRGQQQPVRPK